MTHTCRALTILAWSVILSAGCTRDDSDEPVNSGLITFNAGVDKSVITTEDISEFKVSAYGADNSIVMNNVTVRRTGLNSWQYAPAVTWPSQPVNFIAVSPASIDLSINPWWKHTFAVNELSGTFDLLTAASFNVAQSSSRIKLNFRHALSYVDILLRTDLDNMDVDVTNVDIKGVASHGTFTYPEASTLPGNNTFGQWSTWGNNSSYNIFNSTGTTDLRLSHSPAKACNTGVQFFLPIRLDPMKWEGYHYGSLIEITYRITDRDTGTTVWPDNSTERSDLSQAHPGYGVSRMELLTGIPDSTWMQGRRYIYTITLDIPHSSQSRSSSSEATGMIVEIAQ